ncbi:NAD(P)H-dependent oxidoreductase [Cellulomonas sp. JH27-2]|uniref:NADPH-dependent FMN reductase n=1 Tax=Cellulomonas sp. JH27-2 TaxID=2774139 RepID=UPI00177F1A8E|nr:NAD(P)H-dependent oxidoreductase [Cellulomonas sp. JH27-2]MBD8059634.1 NAD(P)H-dependent oxidoreductase [Cellulomonas sp. JH27-2]
MRIGIVVGSIRDGRRGGQVGRWVLAAGQERGDAEYVLVDLRTFDVPLLTEHTLPAAAGKQYASAAVTAWSEAIDACDAYVFVTPEYNHGLPGAFKNAVDSLGPEWNGKAVAFVSYGSTSGIRAVEQWRQVIANFWMHDIRAQVPLSNFTEFDAGGDFAPDARRLIDLGLMLDELVAHASPRQ